MRNRLAQLFKSEFLRNIATLVSGTTLAQAVPILVSPILTRIYSPEEYGLLALFMSVNLVAVLFANLQYHHAVLLAKEEKDSISILHFCLINITLVSVIAGIAMFFGNEHLASFLNNPDLAPWLYLLPLSIFLAGLVQPFTFWANRNKRYKRISIAGVGAAIATATCSLGFGFAGFGILGLMLGFLAGHTARLSILAFLALRNESQIRQPFDFSNIRQQVRQFKKFPIFNLPSEFMNVLVKQSPVFMLSVFYQVTNIKGIIGLYNQSNRILGLPTGLISNAFGSVFKQKASKEYNENGQCKKTFETTFKFLFGIALFPFLLLFFIAPELFAFVFGEPWRNAGVYTQALTPMFFMRFITSPLTYMYAITARLQEDFILHLLLLLAIFGSLYYGLVIAQNELTAFWTFSLVYSAIYLLYLIRSYQFAKGKVS